MKGDLTTIEAMKKPTQRMVEAARSIGVPVVYTQTQTDTEHDNGPILSRRQRVGLGGAKYTIPGTWGWEICDFVAPRSGEVSIPKWHHSGFTNPKLDATLRSLGAKTLLFTGVATNGCVEGSVRDACARVLHSSVRGLRRCLRFGTSTLLTQKHGNPFRTNQFERGGSAGLAKIVATVATQVARHAF
jgi:nicotinamidase-related amidase